MASMVAPPTDIGRHAAAPTARIHLTASLWKTHLSTDLALTSRTEHTFDTVNHMTSNESDEMREAAPDGALFAHASVSFDVSSQEKGDRPGSQSGSRARGRPRTSSDLPDFTSHAEFLDWHRRVSAAHGSALRAIEAIEAEQRAIAALRLETLAVLAELSDAAAQVVWDPESGRSRVVSRASDLQAARRSTVAEVATRTCATEGQVGAEWDLARQVVVDHPDAVQDLAWGRLSAQHLRVVADESAAVPAEHRAEFGRLLATQAQRLTPGQLRAWARRHREIAYPGSMAVRHRAARAGRYVSLEPGRDGMAWLSAHLTTIAAAAVFDRITAAAIACQGQDEPRTLAQLRADALVDYVLADEPLPGPVGCVTVAEPAGGPATLDVDVPAPSRHSVQGAAGPARVAVEPPSSGAAEGCGDAATMTTTGAVEEAAMVVPFGESARAALARTPRERQTAVATHLADADDVRNGMSSACDTDIYGVRPTVAVTVPHTLLLAAASGSDLSAPSRGDRSAPTRGDSSAPTSGGTGAHASDGSGTPSSGGSGTPISGGSAAAPACETTATFAHSASTSFAHDAAAPLAHERRAPVPELVGHGPIDDETALALLAAAPSLRRILTDPHTGVALDMSRSTYVTPAPLRAFLALRDVTCRFTGCRRLAVRCDVDHVIAWAEGGTTSVDNLVHLCRTHHRLKHTSAWTSQVLGHDELAALTPADVAGHTELAALAAAARDVPSRNGSDAPSDGRLPPSVLRWTDPHGHVTYTIGDLRPAHPTGTASRGEAIPHGPGETPGRTAESARSSDEVTDCTTEAASRSAEATRSIAEAAARSAAVEHPTAEAPSRGADETARSAAVEHRTAEATNRGSGQVRGADTAMPGAPPF